MPPRVRRHGARSGPTTRRAIRGEDGRPLLSWRVRALRYVGANALYERFHLNEPWDSEHNGTLVEEIPRLLTGDRSGLGGRTPFLAVVGPGTVGNLSAFDLISDDRESTALLVEVDDDHAVPWTKPQDFVFEPSAPSRGLHRDRLGQTIVQFSGRNTAFVSADATDDDWRAWFTASGGETVRSPGRGPGELNWPRLRDVLASETFRESR